MDETSLSNCACYYHQMPSELQQSPLGQDALLPAMYQGTDQLGYPIVSRTSPLYFQVETESVMARTGSCYDLLRSASPSGYPIGATSTHPDCGYCSDSSHTSNPGGGGGGYRASYSDCECGVRVTSPTAITHTSTTDHYLRQCGASTVAIDNKIEQAMDLVKSHLMFAVREEVEVLKEQIKELLEKNSQLEYENTILRNSASPETLAKLKIAGSATSAVSTVAPPPSTTSS